MPSDSGSGPQESPWNSSRSRKAPDPQWPAMRCGNCSTADTGRQGSARTIGRVRRLATGVVLALVCAAPALAAPHGHATHRTLDALLASGQIDQASHDARLRTLDDAL